MIKIALLFSLSISSSFSQIDSPLAQMWQSQIKENGFDKEKQSYCFKMENQTFGKNIDLKVRPASVSKLYTTYWALEKLTKSHQFETQFKIKGDQLYIIGGQDPFFVTENLLFLISHLNSLGIQSLNTISYDQNFYLNWSDSSKSISSALLATLRTKDHSKLLKSMVKEITALAQTHEEIPQINIEHFSVERVTPIEKKMPKFFDYEFSFFSSPISHHLKQMNIYSNNFYADKIFSYLGGESLFHQFIDQNLNTTQRDIRFTTGSGLGDDNYTTCAVTLRMLENLEQTILNNGLRLEDIISVPGSDQGTLKNRFTQKKYNGHLSAKTGTLRHTSTLAGYLHSDSPALFGIFNHTYKNAQARALQDSFIKKAIDLAANTKSIFYVAPEYISLSFSSIE